MSLDEALRADRRIKGLVRKFVRRIGCEVQLPAEIVVPVTHEEWSVLADAGRILRVAVYQKGRKAVFSIPSERREPSAWDELRAAFAKKNEPGDDPSEGVFRRARLIANAEVVETLKADETIVRFLRRGEESARDFIHMLEWAVDRIANDATMSPVTLSQLGADIISDSKSLRAGTRRMVLERILCSVAAMEAAGHERDAYACFGIEENPFTSFVTVFAPFSYVLDTGEEFQYPKEMFRAGLAVQLPRQTVMKIRAVRLEADSMITSENAAPFEALVRAGVPCLYTEGYPNTAVVRLLELFASAGATAVHAGDGDLDGFLIADRISSAIAVRRVIADEVASDETLPRKSIAPSSRRRWEAYIAAHSDFAYASSLRIAMERGWVEQESMPFSLCVRRGSTSRRSPLATDKEIKTI